MANATITGTASNFGSISGVLAGDAGEVAGSVTGVITGTLSGSVGVPGSAGQGVPVGGTTGQVLKKASGTDYDTVWGTDLASAAWGTITGTLSSQTDLQTALDAKAPLASPALTGNPTAPTAATGDNDTSIATTAFVQQELLSGTANARNLEVYVRNQTGATLTAGTIVYINGSTGNRPTVTPAQANNDANSAQTFGFTKAAIANNGFGFVIVRGELENIDTSALTEGAQLYLSPTTAGTWTTTKPSAPQHLVYVGIVVRSHPTQGIILVAIQNGYELNELHDVKITSVSNGQVLKYDSAQGLWVNGTDSAGVAWGGITGTLSSQTDLQGALNAKLNSSSPAAVGDFTISGSFTSLTASSALLKYAHSTNIEYSELTRESFTLFADTADKSVEITNAGIRLYDPAASAAATITFPDNSVQSIAFPGFAGYATESYVTTALGSYLTTSAASSTYLTQANAASTYQTQAGMSSYLTTSAAASTYQTQAGMSAYLTTASASSTYAPLASPALTGTPTAPTAAVDTNTTQVATTAYVIGQGYLKSATASSTYAPLASPALTGTPTAPTAAAATNTTQIATTAFVQQEVPAASTSAAGKVELATISESLAGDSNTLVPTVEDVQWMMMNNSYRPYFNVTGGTSGTGAATNPVPPFRYEVAGPNASVAGSAYVQTNNYSGMAVGQGPTVFDFSKKCWVSFHLDNLSATWVGDANNELKAFWGYNSVNNGDDPNGKAIGVWKQGGTSSYWNLMVHNGTTLTKVATTTTMPTGQIQRFTVYSDGAGNVKLYINGTEVASTALGPTGTRADTRFWCSVKQTASAATRVLAVLWYPKVSSTP